MIRKIFILSLALVIVGCTAVDMKSRPPEVSEFPAVSLDYQVAGSREEMRAVTIRFLSEKGIPHRQEIQEPHAYVITAYLMEPEQDGERRVRRTAYRVSLRSISPNDSCTYSSVTWLVQSKGIRERTWRSVESDAGFTPASLEKVKALYSERPCI